MDTTSSSDPRNPQGFCDPAALIAEAFAALLPPPAESVADYAAEHRYLSNPGGGYTGRWPHERAPYLAEPMRLLTSREYDTIAVVGPGQSAKTAITENWLLHAVGISPANMLWYTATEDLRDSYVKGRINPMIDDHPVLRDGLRPGAGNNSLAYKRFTRMTVEFLPGTYNALISKSAPRIVADEIDAYDPALGDIKALLDVRRSTFGGMLLALSHPDRATGLDPVKDWTAGIMQLYADSDQRRWYWPCPRCGGYSSPNPGALRHMPLRWPEAAPLDQVEAEAHLLCPLCDHNIPDSARAAMAQAGRWVARGQDITPDGRLTGTAAASRTAGFWIVGPMSLLRVGGLGSLARAVAKAQRQAEISGDDKTLKEVTVKQLGIPFSRRRSAGSVDAAALAERAEDYPLRRVPAPVRVLLAAIDIQLASFEAIVVGYGAGLEAWVVDRFPIFQAPTPDGGLRPIDPAARPEDWDLLLAAVRDRVYPLAARPGWGLRLRGLVYDTGGRPGVTRHAYDAWRRWRRHGKVQQAGRLGGWDVFDGLLLKGLPGLGAPRFRVAYPDGERRDRAARAGGVVPVGLFNPNLYKDDVTAVLARIEPGPTAIHLSRDLLDSEPPHRFLEQLCAETRRPDGRWDNPHNARNEAFDLW